MSADLIRRDNLPDAGTFRRGRGNVAGAARDGLAGGRHEIGADGHLVTRAWSLRQRTSPGRGRGNRCCTRRRNREVASAVMGGCVNSPAVAPDRHDWLTEIAEGDEGTPGDRPRRASSLRLAPGDDEELGLSATRVIAEIDEQEPVWSTRADHGARISLRRSWPPCWTLRSSAGRWPMPVGEN